MPAERSGAGNGQDLPDIPRNILGRPNYFSLDPEEVENALLNEFLAPFQGLENVREAHGNRAAAELAVEVCTEFPDAQKLVTGSVRGMLSPQTRTAATLEQKLQERQRRRCGAGRGEARQSVFRSSGDVRGRRAGSARAGPAPARLDAVESDPGPFSRSSDVLRQRRRTGAAGTGARKAADAAGGGPVKPGVWQGTYSGLILSLSKDDPAELVEGSSSGLGRSRLGLSGIRTNPDNSAWRLAREEPRQRISHTGADSARARAADASTHGLRDARPTAAAAQISSAIAVVLDERSCIALSQIFAQSSAEL